MAAPMKSLNPVQTPKFHVFESDVAVSHNFCQFIAERGNKAIDERGIFYIGLSGGSAAKFLCNDLPKFKTDWSKWKIFFCDERHVPYEHPECTYKYYKDHLMSKVPLGPDNIFPDNPSVDVTNAADEYSEKLKGAFPEGRLPCFDLLILGMGPDGHTCSLFPNHPLLEEKSKLVAAISDSPKPPPERITLTFPVINNARAAVFVSCGDGKAEMVKRVIEGTDQPLLPASRVKPTEGELHWFLDNGAARLIKASL